LPSGRALRIAGVLFGLRQAGDDEWLVPAQDRGLGFDVGPRLEPAVQALLLALLQVADVLEVLRALAAAYDLSWEDVVSEAGRKRAERGGFDHRIFLEYVDQAQ
jgi:hypothetical protein